MRCVAILALAACSSGPRFVRGPEGEPRPIVEALAPPITFGPIMQPAAEFNVEPEPGPATRLALMTLGIKCVNARRVQSLSSGRTE